MKFLYQMNEQEKELIEKISGITNTDYQVDEHDAIEVEHIMSALDDLFRELENLKEAFKEYKEEIENESKEKFLESIVR